MSDLSKLEIGRLEAENERLREALEKIAADAGVSHDNYERMYRGWRHIATTRIDIAREVLGNTK